MKRIETVTERELMGAYLKASYPGTPVLVIWNPLMGDDPEIKALRHELDHMGYGPGNAMWALDGNILITMPDYAAHQLINSHDHGSFRMELWEDGQCIHENM